MLSSLLDRVSPSRHLGFLPSVLEFFRPHHQYRPAGTLASPKKAAQTANAALPAQSIFSTAASLHEVEEVKMERLLTISEVAGLASATQGQIKYALAAGDVAEPAGRLGPNGARVWTV